MERKAKVFAVRNKQYDSQAIGGVRLVKAKSRAEVEWHILNDFTVEPATVEEVHELGVLGVKIEVLEAA